MNIPNETRVATSGGNPRRDVVVIEGVKSNYAFAGDPCGQVTDFAELAVAGAGGGDDAVLSMLGYRISERVGAGYTLREILSSATKSGSDEPDPSRNRLV
jgi:hypothetical protein